MFPVIRATFDWNLVRLQVKHGKSAARKLTKKSVRMPVQNENKTRKKANNERCIVSERVHEWSEYLRKISQLCRNNWRQIKALKITSISINKSLTFRPIINYSATNLTYLWQWQQKRCHGRVLRLRFQFGEVKNIEIKGRKAIHKTSSCSERQPIRGDERKRDIRLAKAVSFLPSSIRRLLIKAPV
jgi:hypothetical protein